MSLMGTLLGARAQSVEDPTYPLTSSALVDILVGPRSVAGVTVTERTAMGLPAVFRSIALLAGGVAGLPLHGYRDEADVRRRLEPQPRILSSPHPDLTPFEWLELAMVHQLGWGNTYFRQLRDGTGGVRELWPIEPRRVVVGRAADGHKVYGVDQETLSAGVLTEQQVIDNPGRVLPFTDREILHVPGLGYDGIVGMSPIRAAATALATAMASEEHGARFFGSGTMLSGILRTDQKIGVDVATAMKERWKASTAGLDNAHDIAVLGYGTNFEPISISPADAQFIETQKFGVEQVARIFGIPPHMLGHTEKSTSWGTGIEQQSIGYVTHTLRPHLLRFEQRLSTLLPRGEYAKFTVEGLLRGDTKSRYESYAVARQWGWLSPNDIRRLEDMEPVDGGDTYLQPLNMVPLGTEPEEQPDPVGAPPTTTEEVDA